MLRTEIDYLRSLLEETKSKNIILIENNYLLKEKISSLEDQIRSGNNIVKKPVNMTVHDKISTSSSTSGNVVSNYMEQARNLNTKMSANCHRVVVNNSDGISIEVKNQGKPKQTQKNFSEIVKTSKNNISKNTRFCEIL